MPGLCHGTAQSCTVDWSLLGERCWGCSPGDGSCVGLPCPLGCHVLQHLVAGIEHQAMGPSYLNSGHFR